MKKVLSFVLIFTLILTCSVAAVPVSALTSGDFGYKVNPDGTATITAYYGQVTELVIPSTIDGYKVTAFGNFAFWDCGSLERITIPSSVTSIGYSAFFACSSLESITIPDGVEYIGNSAFEYCSSLERINIPSSVTSIGDYVFRRCSSLESITIPDGVKYIGNWAFEDCSSLIGITIPSSVTSIGDDAFRGCDKLTIYGEKNSAAESYAETYGIAFVALGESAHGKVGDTNGDGKVTVADATRIQKHLANILKLEGAELEAADTNGDGKVTVADATQIQKYLANVIPSLG